MNSGEDRIFVTQARLRGFPHSGRSEDKPARVILEPHGSSEFTQEFTIAKQAPVVLSDTVQFTKSELVFSGSTTTWVMP